MQDQIATYLLTKRIVEKSRPWVIPVPAHHPRHRAARSLPEPYIHEHCEDNPTAQREQDSIHIESTLLGILVYEPKEVFGVIR
ncbi:hypothetical protein PsYK624_141390 [Phanerochaete sordida]|uniref:Uncharacterized protein n=1 Tax=Phanerochaete sordida TaxID=48140 RepID=A0A9P3LL46_9APHY|nr:hypothetical protein PsYK624_141390 [Phanerochaete sordida]